MRKRVSAVVGEYINKQGEQKAKWADIGSLFIGKNGKEYFSLNADVSTGGILAIQNAISANKGQEQRESIICSVFNEDNQGAQQQPNYPQPAPAIPTQKVPQNHSQGGLSDDLDF